MIISKTPYRISFFGGGTDYDEWFLNNTGEVLSTTINKYCYINCRYLPPFFDHKIRIIWSTIELCQSIDDIKHPVVREAIKYLNIDISGLEVYHYGDLPARSGIGSSSSFTVGTINALSNLYGIKKSKKKLAEEAIYLEKQILKESVGYQDQIAAAYGGLNHIKFLKNKKFQVKKIKLSKKRKKELNDHLLLVFSGVNRTASKIVKKMLKNYKAKDKNLYALKEKVLEGIKILESNINIKEFGHLLDESWKEKKQLSNNISNNYINEIYEIAKKNGALGGKILGAGGGGFIIFFAEPKYHKKILKKLDNLIHIPFKFEDEGASVLVKLNNEKYNQVLNKHTLQNFKFKELGKY